MIVVDWGNVEETLLIWRFHESWTATDFNLALHRLTMMVNAKSHPVNVIIDARATRNTKSQAALKLHQTPFPDKVQQIIIIDHGDYWQRMFMVIGNFCAHPCEMFTFVQSVDEAYAQLDSVA